VCAFVVGGWHISLAADLSKIQTIVVLYAENRSFDHLYGLFPGANGIADATRKQYIQRDHDGSELPYLRVWNAKGEPDPNYPQLPNAPFRIDAPPVSNSPTDVLLSPIHAYYHSIEQINGGKNDCLRRCRRSAAMSWVILTAALRRCGSGPTSTPLPTISLWAHSVAPISIIII
jgi:phospholipase C